MLMQSRNWVKRNLVRSKFSNMIRSNQILRLDIIFNKYFIILV